MNVRELVRMCMCKCTHVHSIHACAYVCWLIFGQSIPACLVMSTQAHSLLLLRYCRPAEYLGIPYPPPSLQPKASALHGLNFASAGATASNLSTTVSVATVSGTVGKGCTCVPGSTRLAQSLLLPPVCPPQRVEVYRKALLCAFHC